MSSAASRYHHSFRDYLAIEELGAVKHEFLAGEIYAMAGGTPEHAALSAALIAAIAPQLRGGPYRAYTSDLRVRVVATGLATYPDAAVLCDPLERDPESATHVTNPAILFEVLSSATETYDRGEKREHYQQIPSLRTYVVLAQDRPHIEVWQRTEDEWSHATYGRGDTVPLPDVGCELVVDSLYADAGIPAARPD